MNLRLGKITKSIFTSYSYCKKCKTTWNLVEMKTIYFSDNEGCFALCEKCWNESDTEERIKYYKELVNNWSHGINDNELKNLVDNVKSM